MDELWDNDEITLAGFEKEVLFQGVQCIFKSLMKGCSSLDSLQKSGISVGARLQPSSVFFRSPSHQL